MAFFAELETVLAEAFTAIANGSESIAEKLDKAAGLNTSATSLSSIQADTSTTTEQKIMAAYALGKSEAAAATTSTTTTA